MTSVVTPLLCSLPPALPSADRLRFIAATCPRSPPPLLPPSVVLLQLHLPGSIHASHHIPSDAPESGEERQPSLRPPSRTPLSAIVVLRSAASLLLLPLVLLLSHSFSSPLSCFLSHGRLRLGRCGCRADGPISERLSRADCGSVPSARPHPAAAERCLRRRPPPPPTSSTAGHRQMGAECAAAPAAPTIHSARHPLSAQLPSHSFKGRPPHRPPLLLLCLPVPLGALRSAPTDCIGSAHLLHCRCFSLPLSLLLLLFLRPLFCFRLSAFPSDFRRRRWSSEPNVLSGAGVRSHRRRPLQPLVARTRHTHHHHPSTYTRCAHITNAAATTQRRHTLARS